MDFAFSKGEIIPCVQTKTFSCFIRCGFVRGCCTYNDKYGNLQSSGGFQSGWTEEDGRLYYYDEDGYKETNTWKKRNGDWFYLDEEGEIVTNQRVDDYFCQR